MHLDRLGLWLIAGITFFLSLWIVLPAPTLFFLRLAIGAPEVSPFLCLLALLTAAIALWRYPVLPSTLLLVLLLTFLLSSLPLLQQPQAVARAEASMAQAFSDQKTSDHKPALNQPPTPKGSRTQHQSTADLSGPTWRWSYFFRGRPQQPIRYTSNIQFASPDQTTLSLDLYQPSTPGLYPAIVTIYGGGWAAGSPAANAQFSRHLASKGYVVVAIDYRHAPAFRFPAQLEDVQTALTFISNQAQAYEIDPSRVGLVGWSAGAHLAMLAGFQHDVNQGVNKNVNQGVDKSSAIAPSSAALNIRSIVNYYGPVDLTRGYAEPPLPDPLNVRQILQDFIGGTPDDLPEAYRLASPITYVKTATASSLPPTLLIYGGRDHVVESRFGKGLYEAITTSGNRAVWVHIPWAEHAFDKIFNGPSNQLALQFVERFLTQTLKQ